MLLDFFYPQILIIIDFIVNFLSFFFLINNTDYEKKKIMVLQSLQFAVNYTLIIYVGHNTAH